MTAVKIWKRFQLTLLTVLAILERTDGRAGIIFYPSTYQKTWAEARLECLRIGGTLAKITTAEENNEIANYAVKWHEDAMIVGGSEADSVFYWEDGTAADLSIPPSHSLGSWIADKMNVLANGKWEDVPNDWNRPFVCEINQASSEAQAAAALRACWVANGLFSPPPGTETMACPRGTLYFTPESRQAKGDWAAGRAECQSAGGDLAIILTEDENDIITRLKSFYHDMGEPWIGGDDPDDDGVYTWLSNINDPISWPSTYGGSAPGSTGECLSFTGPDDWITRWCSDNRRYLCERNISLSRTYGDVCFWGSSSADTWTAGNTSCHTAGGRPAKVDRAEEWQMILNLGETQFWVGLYDTDSDNRYRWLDNTAVTWSMWWDNEPNSNNDPCTEVKEYEWDDVSCGWTNPIICEKTVSSAAVFANAVKVIEGDKVIYRCNGGHVFADFTSEKTYTCSSAGSFQDFVDSVTDCNPFTIDVMEAQFEDYTAAGFNVLFDGDDGTCVNLNDYWTYLPMTTVRMTAAGDFTVTLAIGANIQAIAAKTIKVFVSRSGTYTGDFYGSIELYKTCESLPNLAFSCQCTGACSLYIRVRFLSMAAAQGIVYSLCEVDIA